MNNKPVAWMAVNGLNNSYSTFTNDQKQRLLPHISQGYSNWIPLYTHPVKELTDEEIAIIGDKCFGTMHYELWLQKNEFARATLLKAQEK